MSSSGIINIIIPVSSVEENPAVSTNIFQSLNSDHIQRNSLSETECSRNIVPEIVQRLSLYRLNI